jgi:hypothetical protein
MITYGAFYYLMDFHLFNQPIMNYFYVGNDIYLKNNAGQVRNNLLNTAAPSDII